MTNSSDISDETLAHVAHGQYGDLVRRMAVEIQRRRSSASEGGFTAEEREALSWASARINAHCDCELCAAKAAILRRLAAPGEVGEAREAGKDVADGVPPIV